MVEAVELAPDLAVLRASIANVYFAGTRDSWVLIDTGVPGWGPKIRAAAEKRFGETKPKAILLTHGHFDHAACAMELAKFWEVPVYAHRMEFPYLTGQSAYPQKDPTVGGAMAFLSRFFPSRTVNIGTVLKELPESHEIPGLAGWRWIEAPGHAPGQVCFWQEAGRIIVAGDALATVDLDSWRKLIAWKQEIAKPPSPFNYNWELARQSVLTIAALKPRILACGHGDPVAGENVAAQLEAFAGKFEPPKHGRYSTEPAHTNENGVFYEPPAPKDNLPKIAAGAAAGVFVVAGLLYNRRRKKPE